VSSARRAAVIRRTVTPGRDLAARMSRRLAAVATISCSSPPKAA
jgi:hypothetical protein